MSTPTEVFWVIYEPLLHILAWSFVTLMLYAVAKFVVFAKGGAWVWSVEATLSSPRLGRKLALVCLVGNQHHRVQHMENDISRPYHNNIVTSRVNKPARRTPLPLERRYERSRIERILDCPVRAKSLIRNALQIETTDATSGRVHISPSCYWTLA